MIMDESGITFIKDEKFGINQFNSQKSTFPVESKIQSQLQPKSIFSSSYSFSQNQSNDFHSFESKITPKMFLGNQQIFINSYQDDLPNRKIKKHLDDEYLDRFRYEYNFVQTPPRSEIESSNKDMVLILSQDDCIPIIKQTKSQKKMKEKSEKKKKQYQFPPIKKKELQDVDDLPIALRRTKRPITKPLRFWLGEKIIYKIDEETGCYTKSSELKFD